MPAQQLKDFLDRHGIKYVSITHSPAYTAQEVAGSAHVHGYEMAKTVMVKLDGKMAMAVIPAPCRVDLDLLRQAAEARHASLASEAEFANVFPACDVGAMPPFGNLYDMPVYADEALMADELIAFNACSHTEVVRMRWDDYDRLVEPRIARITQGALAHTI